MLSMAISAAIALPFPAQVAKGWEISCLCPLDMLIRDLHTTPKMMLPVPGAPKTLQERKAQSFSISLMPDIIQFEEAVIRPGQSFSFSHETTASGFKGQVLRRLGLVEVRSRGFGATLRFASAKNWAFQFKGLRKLTVAYVMRF